MHNSACVPTDHCRVLLYEASSNDGSDYVHRLIEQMGTDLEVVHVDQLEHLLDGLDRASADAVLLGLGGPDQEALSIFATVHAHGSDLPIVVLGAGDSEGLLIRAVHLGARDYLLMDQIYPTLVRRTILHAVEKDRAERARKGSEEILRQMAENIREVFWMANPDHTQMLYVSPAFEAIVGIAREELYANPTRWLEAIHPADQPRVREALDNHPIDKFEAEYRIIRPSDGETRWIHDRSFPIRDEQGHLYRVAGIAEDITDRRRLEEQLRQSERLEAVGRLASGIAHDFNNLLNVIDGNAQLLEMIGDESVRECTTEIFAASERASSLVRQLLAFSRQQILQPEVLVLNEVVTEISRMLGRVIHNDITIVTRLDPSLGSAEADPGQLHQVVMNLAVNARDAMPDGGTLTLSTSNAELTAGDAAKYPYTVVPGSYVVLRVRDTGIGMDRATLERIFEPFFTTKSEDSGTGLGLSSVYGIVKQSRGYIWARSEPGEGTEFEVYLPRVEAAVSS